jgi:hypothetical protein
MIRRRKISRPIDADASLIGLKLFQGLTFIGVCLVLILYAFIPPSLIKGIQAILLAIVTYCYFLFDLKSVIRRLIDYKRTPKKQTGESICEFEEISDVSMNKDRKTVFSMVETEANYGALDPSYQEQLASEYAAGIYEMTVNDAIVKIVSYTTSEELYNYSKQLKRLNFMPVNDRVKHIYSKRLSLHARIADKAVKNNYIVKVSLPRNSETEWDDVLFFGQVIGPNKIKHSQMKQLLPIQKLERGDVS